MIHILETAKVVFFSHAMANEVGWWDKVAVNGGEVSGLILQTVRSVGDPVCPTCAAELEPEQPARESGRHCCPLCQHVFMGLAFIHPGGGEEWYTFPWPY